MIISEVTQAQLAAWKSLWLRHRDSLTPNRIDGMQLDRYFRAQYQPRSYTSARFLRMLTDSAAEQGSHSPDIAAYTLDGGILVGIDRASGWFHVECADIRKAVPVWDDLFFTRGLSKEDLQNFVLTAQYLLIARERQANAEDAESCTGGCTDI